MGRDGEEKKKRARVYIHIDISKGGKDITKTHTHTQIEREKETDEEINDPARPSWAGPCFRLVFLVFFVVPSDDATDVALAESKGVE